MAKFDHERAHMAANLVSDPPVGKAYTSMVHIANLTKKSIIGCAAWPSSQ